jgi:hypothetical protein
MDLYTEWFPWFLELLFMSPNINRRRSSLTFAMFRIKSFLPDVAGDSLSCWVCAGTSRSSSDERVLLLLLFSVLSGDRSVYDDSRDERLSKS